MKKIFENEYFELKEDREASIFLVKWKAESEKIQLNELPVHAQKVIGTLLQGHYDFFIADDTEFKVAITPDMQSKMNADLLSKLNGKIKKFAHVESEDMIAQLSVEQLFDENTSRTYEDKYFSSLQEALDWVK